MSNLLLEASNINTPPERLKKLAYESIELTRVVAKNPCTPPDLLETLIYVRQDEEVHKNITSNPNTPSEELLELGAEFPRELINNPVFPLLLLENPSLFYEMSFETAISILSLNDVPEEYFIMAANYEHDDVLNVIANHIKVPSEALTEIVENNDEEHEAYFSAIFHVNYNLDKVDAWEDFLDHAIQNFYFLWRIKEKEEFLYNIGIVPEKLLSGLLLKTRIKIFINPKTPIILKELLDKTLGDSLQIDLAQASNPDTPIEILIALSNRYYPEIEKAIVENPSTPIFILEKLARERNIGVETFARNYNITNSFLEKICQNDEVAEIIKENRNTKTPKDILQFILEEHEKIESQNGCVDFDSFTQKKFCVYLYSESDVPDKVFKELETVSDIDLLIALARHSKTPAHIFERIYKIAKRKDYYLDCQNIDRLYHIILMLLAKNPYIPIYILFQLTQYNCYEIRRAAIHNIQTNFALYSQYVVQFLRKWEQANNPETSPDILSKIANEKNASLCFAVAQNPNTPTSALDKLAFHKSRDVRQECAKNPNTTIDTLVALSKKRRGCLYVRQSAIKALIDKDPKKAGTALTELVSSSEPTAPRFIFLLHSLCPSEFLEQHGSSTSWLERYAVAQNPNTPQHILENLKNDVNRIVRTAAYENKTAPI